MVAARGVRVRMVQEIKDGVTQVNPAPPAPATPPTPTPKSAPPPSGTVQRPSRSGSARQPSQPAPRPAQSSTPQQQPQRPQSTPTVQPANRVSQIQQRSDPPASPLVINVPTTAPKKATRTPEGTDKDRMFLFSQFAAALKAGISPADFLQNVAVRTRGIYRGSLEKMAEAAREGTPMSAVMELYPDLYPVHVVALTRAGEVGGFLPEALETIAQQAEQAHKFKRWFAWIWFVIINAALSIPGIIIITKAATMAWRETEARGGEVGQKEVLGFVGHYALQRLIWPIGPASIGFYLALYLLWRIYLGRLSRPFRHQVAISWPAFGPRARAENMAIFSWTMGKLTNSGIPYQSAWQLAAASAPNDVMARRLGNLGQKVGGEQPISSAMVMDRNLFPPEYANVVGTAEFTGDIPGALDQISRLSRGEYESAQNAAKIRGGCWGALGCTVTAAAILGLFMYWYYYQLIPEVTRIDGPNESP